MEHLIKCSNVLYDNDIKNKMSEIVSLQKRLRFHEKPQIEYDNLEEWKVKQKEAYQIIRNGLHKWIVEDRVEYLNMSTGGLTPIQVMYISDYIEEALNLITKQKNKEWANMVSCDVIYGIEGFINSLIETGVWNLIYSNLNPLKMSNLIYNNILWQLDNGRHWPCILENIAIYTCNLCGKKDAYAKCDNICIKCEEKNDV